MTSTHTACGFAAIPKRIAAWTPILAGLAAWGAACALWSMDLAEAFLLFAPLVIVPLGLRLIDDEGTIDLTAREISARMIRTAKRLQLPAAILLACGFAAPPGAVAGWSAVPWLAFTLLCAVAGGLRLLDPSRLRRADRWMIDAALVLIAVGGVNTFAYRGGIAVGDFPEGIILLTGVHFHYAGFALPLLTARAIAARPGRFATATSLAVVATIVLVGVGITFSPALELAASLGLIAACVSVAGLQFVAADDVRSPLAWTLLMISALALVAGMSVAGVYAIGEYRFSTGLDPGPKPIDIPAMIPLHGALNGLGFSLCGLLAWNLHRGTRSIEPRTK
ncbi:MAG: YndJ family transporter [Planctomycetaceae bacterium]